MSDGLDIDEWIVCWTPRDDAWKFGGHLRGAIMVARLGSRFYDDERFSHTVALAMWIGARWICTQRS